MKEQKSLRRKQGVLTWHHKIVALTSFRYRRDVQPLLRRLAIKKWLFTPILHAWPCRQELRKLWREASGFWCMRWTTSRLGWLSAAADELFTAAALLAAEVQKYAKLSGVV